MMDFGPFDDYSDALSEACSLILSKPNASVVHIKDPELALRVSTEYCAWLYYTPEDKYQMSMLTDQSDADDLQKRRRTCRLPSFVDDQRYYPWDIKYVFALHNHPALHEFTRTGEGWFRRDIGQVTWINSTTYRLNDEVYDMGRR